MEASVFGTPQTAPPEEQVPQAAPEQAAPPTQAPAEATAPETTDPVMAQLQSLQEKVEGLGSPQKEPEAPADDLLSALEGEVFEPQAEQQTPPEPTPQEQQADPEAMRQWEILQGAIREEAQQLVAPILERERTREMAAVATRYPDIRKPENVQAIAQRLQGLEAESGVENLWQNPAMVEQTYKVIRAEAAEAQGVPAEQAAQGASVETNAGQSQTGGSSESEDYINQVYGGNGTRSIFAGG